MSLEPLDLENSKEGKRLKALFRQAQVGMCVNGVTHDANNMMGAIMAYAELIGLDGTLDEKKQHMLRQIEESVSRCSELLGKLTDIARKETDELTYCDIPLILDAALKLRSYDHNLQRIQVETEIPPVVSGILGNPPKLQLAFMQLLHNAEEALQDSEEKCLRIIVEGSDEGVEVSFWNAGPPLSNDLVEACFNAYTTTRNDAHIGLGLAMVREIVEEAHDGSLTYTPERGFMVTLPQRHIV